jgi:hypothetical protein
MFNKNEYRREMEKVGIINFDKEIKKLTDERDKLRKKVSLSLERLDLIDGKDENEYTIEERQFVGEVEDEVTELEVINEKIQIMHGIVKKFIAKNNLH